MSTREQDGWQARRVVRVVRVASVVRGQRLTDPNLDRLCSGVMSLSTRGPDRWQAWRVVRVAGVVATVLSTREPDGRQAWRVVLVATVLSMCGAGLVLNVVVDVLKFERINFCLFQCGARGRRCGHGHVHVHPRPEAEIDQQEFLCI